MEVVKTDSRDKDFFVLIELLEEDLYERYGDAHKEYEQYNKLDLINDVVIVYDDALPVACGGFKEYDRETVELKRIFVKKECRGRGLAKLVISSLEQEALRRGYEYAVLETGEGQQEAMGLYKKIGYRIIENYGPYKEMPLSVCMKKKL